MSARKTLRTVCRNAKIALATVAVLLLFLGSVGRGDDVSKLRVAVGSYEQDILRWEVSHFMDKWLERLQWLVLRQTPDDEERAEALERFFELGPELSAARDELRRELAETATLNESVVAAQTSADELREERDALRPIVEEVLEGAITRVLQEMSIIDSLGPLRWPPVDFTFEENGHVLVRSPRDRIARLDDMLLDSNVSLVEQVRLEDEIEAAYDNTSALVVQIGGVATYPAQVSPHQSLHGTLVLASHEWLHHWLAFRPLGRTWFEGGVMQSVNETVANIVGEEVGDRAYELITGETIEREPWTPPSLQPREPIPEDVFDFRREMRETRLRLEELLEAGRIADAEAYLEQRRQLFVDNGFHIRKLNNAWFAFFGTYADSAASISPLEAQLRTIRADSGSLAGFLDRLSGVTEYERVESMAIDAGWEPLDTSDSQSQG